LDFLNYLAIDGTLGVRARYDRRYGEIIGDVPYKDGTPILDPGEAAKYVAEKASNGQTATIRTLREGKICWEILTAENILPPPGYHHPRDFPWHLIKRPVDVAEIKHRYGDLAENVIAEEIDNSASLTAGYRTDGTATKLENKAFVYTGYDEPNQLYPKGRTVVFTETALLDVRDSLPLTDHPLGPKTGMHYFRWQVLPGRFMGKAFIENGIGPQKIYNKRHTQLNAIIDRNMPVVYIEEQSLARRKTGEPFEYVEVRPGAPLPQPQAGVQPGAWFMEDIRNQVESVERALGVRGVTMGQAPSGVSAYSAMALLTENDALKLDPIGQSFREVMEDLCWDTLELMRNWPRGKRMDIEGPKGRVDELVFDANDIPARYLLKRTNEGSMPRSQAAEIQKINDIWAAAGGKLPLTWYVESLNAGKPQAIPASIGDADAHRAELENTVILNTLQAPPVAPYDDDELHVNVHRQAQMEAQTRVDMGDEDAQALVDTFEMHILEHEESARTNAIVTPPAGAMVPQPSTPAPEPGGHPLGSGMPEGGMDVSALSG
jgi:hypothetical protein